MAPPSAGRGADVKRQSRQYQSRSQTTPCHLVRVRNESVRVRNGARGGGGLADRWARDSREGKRKGWEVFGSEPGGTEDKCAGREQEGKRRWSRTEAEEQIADLRTARGEDCVTRATPSDLSSKGLDLASVYTCFMPHKRRMGTQAAVFLIVCRLSGRSTSCTSSPSWCAALMRAAQISRRLACTPDVVLVRGRQPVGMSCGSEGQGLQWRDGTRVSHHRAEERDARVHVRFVTLRLLQCLAPSTAFAYTGAPLWDD
eukprot:552194-Pleurochrysis_carterae.AAC.2